MSLVPRSGARASGPDAAARVLALLGTDRGWVPTVVADVSEEAPPPAFGSAGGSASAEGSEQSGSGQGGSGQGGSGQGGDSDIPGGPSDLSISPLWVPTAPAPQDRLEDVPAEPPSAEVSPAAEVPPSAEAPPAAEATVDVSAETPDGPPDGPPGTVRALLRSGRIDPGRQGVLALGLVGLVAAALAAYFVLKGRPTEQPLTVPPVAGSVQTSAGPELVIDVAGRVRHPGLVRLPAGARVDDALKAAGGVLPGTPTASLNLARKVADGEQVLVGVQAAGPSGTVGGLLDLNTATAAELDALPGIGPVLADKIVSWRTEHGRFASIDQLREVGGIGESKYASLKSKVRV